jgi:hypothetical protein
MVYDFIDEHLNLSKKSMRAEVIDFFEEIAFSSISSMVELADFNQDCLICCPSILSISEVRLSKKSMSVQFCYIFVYFFVQFCYIFIYIFV